MLELFLEGLPEGGVGVCCVDMDGSIKGITPTNVSNFQLINRIPCTCKHSTHTDTIVHTVQLVQP